MKKIFSVGIIGVTAVALLAGCQQEDRETKRQLEQLQSQLEAEKAEKAQREAQERAKQQEQEQLAREEQIRQEAEESVRAQLKMEAEAKAAQQKAAQQQKVQQQKAQAATPKFTEKVVRYPATVVTQSGYGELSLRGEPSTKGIEVSKVYDGNEVTVISKTNKCEVIGNIDGCWVKVQLDNAKGYMFDGYLNREVLSQQEKQKLQNSGNSEEECIDC